MPLNRTETEVATVPAKPRRRALRFSLRTFFVLLTIGLLILGYRANTVATWRRATAQLKARGGNVLYRDGVVSSPEPDDGLGAWFREVTGLRSPSAVYLTGKDVTDEVLGQEVLPLSTLGMLSMSDVSVTNEGLGQLASLKWLTTLACIRDTRNAKVFQELARPTTVEFDLVPLSDSLDYLADLHGIPIALDRAALAAANINPDLSLTSKLANVRLEKALEQLLWPEQIGWNVIDGRLAITPAPRLRRKSGKPPSVASASKRQSARCCRRWWICRWIEGERVGLCHWWR